MTARAIIFQVAYFALVSGEKKSQIIKSRVICKTNEGYHLFSMFAKTVSDVTFR